MKKTIHIYTFLMALAMSLNVYGMNIGDSIGARADSIAQPTELSGVTVTAARGYLSEGGRSVFLPTSREKKISQDGASLLMNMAIASVYVSPENGSLSTPSGEGIAAFIDFLPASAQDLANIRTADVKRVEVYDFPDDPRFGGAAHVVNFVLVKYEYGGYTKLSAMQRFVNLTGDYNLYSKVSYKRMTYDAGGGYDFTRTRHRANESSTVYSFPDGDVTYRRKTEGSFQKTSHGNGFFRAIYRTDKAVISNIVGLTRNRIPRKDASYTEWFSSPAYVSGDGATAENSKDVSVTWNGVYQFIFPKDYTLTVQPQASYGHFNTSYSFTDGLSDLNNLSKEDAWSVGLDATARKSFGRQSAYVSLSAARASNDMDYLGTTPAQVDAVDDYISGRFGANLAFGRFTIQPSLTLVYTHTDIADARRSTFFPKYFLVGSYFINQRNSLSLSSEMYYATLPINQLGPNIQLRNQIEAITGNPHLKESIHNSVKLQYQYMPLNNLFLSAYCGFSHASRMIWDVYEPFELDDQDYMLRSYANSGISNVCSYGVTASLSLLKGALNLRGSVSGISSAIRGYWKYTGTHPWFSLQANYSVRNVYFSAAYQHSRTRIGTGMVQTVPKYYTLSAGWSKGELNVSLKGTNLFSASYKGLGEENFSNGYHSFNQAFSPTYHRSFELSVVYTIGYGKEVNRYSETAAPQGVQSGTIN